MKARADELLAKKGLAQSRSQAASLIKLGHVTANKELVKKPGELISLNAKLAVTIAQTYVSRAGLKLASAAKALGLNFKDKTMLDVGSSTGGFTDYALKHGIKKVIAVDVGTKQMHKSLIGNPKIELHEQTDIREFNTSNKIDTIVVDVSFVSLREILPSLIKFMHTNTELVAMVKPQFEAQKTGVKHKGVIKNDAMRRKILKEFELWAKNLFIIINKSDSEVAGSKGNIERFYLLKQANKQ